MKSGLLYSWIEDALKKRRLGYTSTWFARYWEFPFLHFRSRLDFEIIAGVTRSQYTAGNRRGNGEQALFIV